MESERASLLSLRDLALVLIAVGGDMTDEGDEFVPQATWDGLFADGLAETRRPLHGDVYSSLTADGWRAVADIKERVHAA